MSAVPKYSDGLLYQLRVVRDNLDDQSRHKIDVFSEKIRSELLNSSLPIREAIKSELDTIFETRLIGLRFFLRKKKNLASILEESTFPYFESMAQTFRFEKLANKILEALRYVQLVQQAIFPPIQNNIESGEISVPDISLSDWKASLQLLPLPSESIQVLEDLFITGLYIEYIMCAVSLIFDDHMLIQGERLQDLYFTLSDASAAYAVLVIEAGIIPDRSIKPTPIKTKSRGAFLFEKALSDKREIHQHLTSGGTLSALNKKFRFVAPLSTGNH